MDDVRLSVVGPHNLDECGIGCVLNRKHPGYDPKVDWLRKRFEEGLRLLMLRGRDGKPLAFLECIPGQHAWRPVVAPEWLFVHCLWVYPRARGMRGLGQRLLRTCCELARSEQMAGVAALASDGPWMAPSSAFLRQSFRVVDQRDRFDLLAYSAGDHDLPRFGDLDTGWNKTRGLHAVYSNQCPYLPKSVQDVAKEAADVGVPFHTTLLETAEQAQRAPSYYGVFTLLFDGQVLSDHYVSAGRFRNLLKSRVLPT